MTTKVWTFDLEDGKHTVKFDHSLISGKKQVWVDMSAVDRPGKQKRKLFELSNEIGFAIGDHPCKIVTKSGALSYNYDLIVDGRSMTTGQNVASQSAIPGWAWIFMIACGSIPFITLGGVLPAMIGFGAAGYCSTVARDDSKSTDVRVITCVAVTALAWIVVLMIGVGVGTLMGR